jgi:peptide/nickel transport system permease protein
MRETIALQSSLSKEAIPSTSLWSRFRSIRWRKSPLALVGGTLVLVVVTLALLAPLIAPHDPVKQSLSAALRPPFWQSGGDLTYPLGTDQFGRDVLSRMLYGARISLLIAVLAALCGAIVGVTLGLISGYYGGWVGALIMRLVDLNLAFPLILLALAIVAILGPSTRVLILVMTITAWMIYARVVRGVTLSLSTQEFVQSARISGASGARILVRHLLPNLMAPIIVIWTLEIARIILLESALSFLGLGVPPPTPTWGRMLAEGRGYLTLAGWISIFPGLAIMVTVLGINLLGDGIRDLLDPRMRKSL